MIQRLLSTGATIPLHSTFLFDGLARRQPEHEEVHAMKKSIALLGLFALFTGISAAAAESALPPAPLDFAELGASSAACSTMAARPVPDARDNEPPSWLSSDPLFWAQAKAWGCKDYCIYTCGGCCAFPGPGICACC